MTPKQLSIVLFSLFFIALPMEVLHAVLWLGHTLYEWIEYGLDLLLHHAFGFDRRTTQIMVFYLMLLPATFALFLLLKRAWVTCLQLHYKSKQYCAKLKGGFDRAKLLRSPKSVSVPLSAIVGLTVIGLLSF